MRPDEHKQIWDKIHSEQKPDPISSIISERKRLQAFWEARLHAPKPPNNSQGKRHAKGKAKAVGSHLKSSFLKYQTSIENPQIRGKYVSIPVKVIEYAENEEERKTCFEKPTMPKTYLLPTTSPLHQSTYYVGCEWDEGKDKFYLPTSASERIAYMRKCWGI